MPRTIHVIGAGLSGLAAAVRLAGCGENVIVHEAARQAGGRCRSYHDQQLDMVIDNGNHLLLSGNRSALAYLDSIGARSELRGPNRCEIAFADMATGERWTLRPNEGRAPWWVFVERRRVPGTRPLDYLAVAPLLRASRRATIFSVKASMAGRPGVRRRLYGKNAPLSPRRRWFARNVPLSPDA